MENKTTTGPAIKETLINAETLSKAVEAARLGREVLLHYFGRLKKIEEKHLQGLVSEADKESEKIIFDFLKKHFPEDEFLGEESTDVNNIPPPNPHKGRWIVDPLDGTTNYVHQFPLFAVSIGYEFNGKIEVAVIDLPKMGEVYTALRGHGAHLNGEPIHVSKTKTLYDSFVATGFVRENVNILNEQIRTFDIIVRKCRGVRRSGAAAYDLCQVAKGVFDTYWEKGLKPWDGAAGLLLVEEAGGLVSTYRGKPYTPYSKTIIAGNKMIASELQQQILPCIDQDSD